MKKTTFLVTLLMPLFAIAAERSVTDAAAVAAQFMNEQYAQSPARKASCNATSFILSHTRAKLNGEAPAFYVFNKTSQDGYVVVSADDRTEDVLVYSENGTFDPENINPNFRFWLNRLQEEISAANDENTYTSVEKKARKATMVTAISPLLKNSKGEEIAWYQEEPYSDQCPMDQRDDTRCLTGCVATAAAQIMYKWRYPAQGTGSHSYTWYDCKNDKCDKYWETTLSKDFSTVTFEWDNMLANYNSGATGTPIQKNAVATLMYCCGIACDMGYGGNANNGSGAWTDDMGYGMTKYFGYKLDKFISTYSSKTSYQSAKGTSVPISSSSCEWNVSTSTFTTYFNTELEAGRPILMGGEDSDGGHEFVCDGRNTSGYFHINWGWEGESNNYCLLSALTPSKTSYNFSRNIDALIGLQPAVVDTVHVTGVTVAPTSKTLKQKEKVQLTATVAPTNATVKTVTWSSSNSAVATVSATGLVVGVAQGTATITVATKDGNKVATCAITVTNEIVETTDCDAYSYTFTKKCAFGSATLGSYNWTVSATNQEAYVGFDNNNRGAQYGSKDGGAIGQLSFTTSNVAECLVKSITINAAIGSKGDGKLAVYIDGTQIGTTQTLTSTSADYTFTNKAELKGNLEIRYTNTAKAVYIKTININPSTPTVLEETTTPTSQITSAKLIINGQLYIQSGENLYNAQGQLVR